MFGLKIRFKAFGFHLLLSAIIAASIATLILLLWYPWPYSAVCGGVSLLLIVTSVDIVLGPLLTFVIFDRRKPRWELVRDVAFVGLLQLAGLGYGAYAVYIARPVALVFEGARFRVVTNAEVIQEELAMAPLGLRVLSNTGPRLLGTRSSRDQGEILEAITQAMSGVDVGARPKFWQDFDLSREQALSVAKPMAALYQKYPGATEELDAEVKKSGRNAAQLRFLPMISKRASWVVLLDAKTAEPVGFVAKDGFF